MSTPQREARLAGGRQGMALIAAMLLPIVGILSLPPNLPALFRQFADVPHSAVLVPMIITMSALCIATFSPLMGLIADRWGRRRLLLGALGLYCVVGALPALLDNLYAIIACRAAVGVAEAAIMTTGNALMGDYFPGAERHKWLGLQSTIGPIAAAALILSGGALGTINWHAPFLLYALGLPVLIFALAVTWEPQAVAHEAGPATQPAPFPWSALARVGAVTLLTSLLYYAQVVQFGVIFGALGLESPARIGICITIASLGVLAGGWSYRKLGRRHITWLLALLYAAYAVGFAGLGLARDYRVGVVFALICQFGNGVAVPALVNWALNTFDFAHRGRGMGLWNSCFFVGQFLSPLLLTGLIAALGGILPAVTVLGIICLVAAVLAWALFTRTAAARQVVAEPR